MSKGDVTMLVLLDLSAAFDTIDHKILMDRLLNKYGVTGTALKWFQSYLTNRTQSVLINETESRKLPLTCGVPQGSKLGPILFNAYIAPLSEIAKRNGIVDEKYADDEQLLLSFKPNTINDQATAIAKMEKCIDEIRKFLFDNKLCNNSEKTELLLIGSSHQLNKLSVNHINIENTKITGTSNVKNLGVIFDNHMTMEKQVNKMCKNAYFNIRNISKIKKHLDKDSLKAAVNALVSPHLDYGNALLYGIPRKLINKLQITQNSAVRLIENVKRHERITNYRKALHWLPIEARIQFKILATTWKTLNKEAPDYLQNLLETKPQNRTLRSSEKWLLRVPDTIGSTRIIDRSFSVAGPSLWNPLPENLKNADTLKKFKKDLKTHLFSLSYNN
jgi:hypothetical protein